MHVLKMLIHYNIVPRYAFHVGAHNGQEAAFYRSLGIERAVFVEASPITYKLLEANLAKQPGYEAVNALCSYVDGQEVDFHVSSNSGGSSSMLEPGRHLDLYPEISFTEKLRLRTVRADALAQRFPDIPFDLMVIDTQGAEMSVLGGAIGLLHTVRILQIEVSETPLYEGGCTFEEVTDFVRQFGFHLRYIQIGPKEWGDALYVRRAD
jgi:FkbM family methyltransferase